LALRSPKSIAKWQGTDSPHESLTPNGVLHFPRLCVK
jgi:hypothetical protein